ncbi:PAXNEB-domain-containing protein [Ramaria rubella]|nr:PAXNEB-domain-containing protein [Ramaria rubella]
MSFKRRGQTRLEQLPGVRPSRSTPSICTVSTGISSLDDVLGGGLPLGSILVVLAPDSNTVYAELVQRYFIAQGIASGQNVCILNDSAADLASRCMWMPDIGFSSQESPGSQRKCGDDGDEISSIKIAWRYESMRQFQTSIDDVESIENAYHHPLDLMCRIPEQVLHSTVTSKQLSFLSVSSPQSVNTLDSTIARLDDALCKVEQNTSTPIRVSIPSLGCPQWGDMLPSDVLRFLHFLRARFRQNSSSSSQMCALLTLPSYLSQDDWGGPGWSQKLGWFSDGCITLRSFSSDPSLLSMFPSYHGFVNIHSLPAPHCLTPSGDKFSELRGLATSSSFAAGGGENNLAFKCTRKRFIIETLHLDVEGGVNERRTTASVASNVGFPKRRGTGTIGPVLTDSVGMVMPEVNAVPKKKLTKSVTFQSNRPELYDF